MDHACDEPEDAAARRDRRVAVEMDVRISTIDPERDPVTGRPYYRTSQETCANVSSGGAFVLTRELVRPGRRLLVELDVPGGPRLQTVARVAWSRATAANSALTASRQDPDECGIGLEFERSSSESWRALDDFLDKARPDKPRDP